MDFQIENKSVNVIFIFCHVSHQDEISLLLSSESNIADMIVICHIVGLGWVKFVVFTNWILKGNECWDECCLSCFGCGIIILEGNGVLIGALPGV